MLMLMGCSEPELSEREKKIFSSLGLDRLGEPNSASNRYFNDSRAVALGSQLFSDPALSSTGTFSCASCHQPDKHFADGLPVAQAIGPASRNTPTIVGSAWHIWQYWDGRRDSLWSQALTPIEADVEMGNNRTAVARLLINSASYAKQYESIFGAFPLHANDAALTVDASPYGSESQKRAWYAIDKNTQEKINTIFANSGKAIAAFEGTLAPKAGRFDEFVDRIITNRSIGKTLSRKELAGARLFINEKKTQCLECHNGPLLSNGGFHNTGSGNHSGTTLDFGRFFGAQAVLLDEFNCQGRFSDTNDCPHFQFMNRANIDHSQGAFKTPSLRGVSATAPYFHDGRLKSLEEVVQHYAEPPDMNQTGRHELRKFPPLSDKEKEQLASFLKTL